MEKGDYMNDNIANNDKSILRELARQQIEIAKSEAMTILRKEWMDHGSFVKGSRPLIRVELDTFVTQIIPPLLQCEGDFARQIEWQLYSNFLNHTKFADDSVVKDHFEVRYGASFVPFGLPEIKEYVGKKSENDIGLGHHFVSQIFDLENDMKKLGKSSFNLYKSETEAYKQQVEEIFGDILPVKLSGGCQVVSMTQNIVHLMSMQDMFISIIDTPDEFKQMMQMLTNDYIEFYEMLEKENVLTSTVQEQWLGQGSYCFTNKLPSNKVKYALSDIWCYMDSQETVSVSPEMFEEFIFPYYKQIADSFGRISFGCCEPVDPYYENCFSKMANLGKLSISPWANEEYMGEQLRGKDIVYMRKPSPNFLGVGTTLDEDAIKSHINKTLNAAKGCHIEFIQRDVYDVQGSTQKVRKYVDIIRSCI